MERDRKKVIGLIVMTLFLLWVVLNFNLVFNFLGQVVDLLFPFILGTAMAFVLNILTKFFERKLFSRNMKKNKKSRLKVKEDDKPVMWKRVVSMILAIIVLLAIIALVFGLVIPELVNTFKILVNALPDLLEQGKVYLADLLVQYPEMNETLVEFQTAIENININDEISKLLDVYGSGILATSISVISGVAGGIVTFVLAFAFAIYALIQKEKLMKI